MQENILLNNGDLLVMNLINYFITEENYNPMIVHGANNEIWLENMNSFYKVIRIVNNHIHNDEQLKFDGLKLNQIVKQIKRNTLSFKVNVLNIYTNLGDNVHLANSVYDSILINKEKDIKNKILLEVFPNIVEKTNHKEKGFELLLNLTNSLNKANEKNNRKAETIFSKKLPIVTLTIIGICCLLFILMYFFGNGSTDTYTLLLFGANLDVLTKSGQIYRLLTCTFLHIGFIHLFFNMYSLYIIGSQVENFFGKWKYILIYLISGISGSILSLAFSVNTVSAGASGAIFGLMGALLYFGFKYRGYIGKVIKSQILPIIIFNLFLGFTSTGIDNMAHIGGLIGGILTSMFLGIPEEKNKMDKTNGLITLIIYLGFIVYLSFFRV